MHHLTVASADFAAYNDDGTYSTFVDMGINGPNWNQTFWTINGPSDGYVYNSEKPEGWHNQHKEFVPFDKDHPLKKSKSIKQKIK